MRSAAEWPRLNISAELELLECGALEVLCASRIDGPRAVTWMVGSHLLPGGAMASIINPSTQTTRSGSGDEFPGYEFPGF